MFRSFCNANEGNVQGKLLHGIIHAFMSKVKGGNRPKYSERVLNFFMLLESTNRAAFEVVSGNLLGPCLRTMKRINRSLRQEPYIEIESQAVEKRLKELIKTVFKDSNMEVIMSMSFDATRVPQCLQVSVSKPS